MSLGRISRLLGQSVSAALLVAACAADGAPVGATSAALVPDAGMDISGKVSLCHIPPGNPNNPHVIQVSAKAAPAHLAHGDTLDDSCGPVTQSYCVCSFPELICQPQNTCTSPSDCTCDSTTERYCLMPGELPATCGPNNEAGCFYAVSCN